MDLKSQLTAELAHSRDIAAVSLKRSVRVDMALHTYSINISSLLDRFEQLNNPVSLGRKIFIIIIVKELYGTVRSVLLCVFPGKFKSLFHKTVPYGLIPHASFRAQPRRAGAKVVSHRLIHYIPGIDYPGVIAFRPFDYTLNVILHALKHQLFAGKRSSGIIVFIEKPVRRLRMPYQSMPSHLQSVVLCIIQSCFTGIKVQGSALPVSVQISFAGVLIQYVAWFHLIFHSQAIELLLYEVAVNLCRQHTIG